MLEVRVTGFTLATDLARIAENGVLGWFDCDVGPFRLVGCTLRRNHDGGLATHPPLCRHRPSHVSLTDAALRLRLVEAAVAALKALGGSVEAGKADV